MEAVVKVGGSLAEHPRALKELCVELARLAGKHAFVVVPGGGRFADVVREMDAKLHLPAVVSHRLAILAMDQYGGVLSQLIPCAVECSSLEAAMHVSGCGKVPILLPSKLMLQEDALEASWDVTSDSIAASLAGKLHAQKVVFVTDVDGVFSTNPKTSPDAQLRSTISVEDLLSFPERTSVDKFLPKLLLQTPLDCYVVNGLYPQRVGAVLSGQQTVSTRITLS